MWARSFRLLAIAVVSLLLGYLTGSNYRQPEMVTVAESLLPEIIEVEVPVEVVKEVEVIKKIEVVK